MVSESDCLIFFLSLPLLISLFFNSLIKISFLFRCQETIYTSLLRPLILKSPLNRGSTISAVQLTGDNYAEWEVEMMNALRAKRKLGFVDGSIKNHAADWPDFESWTSVNSMVIGWLRTSIAPRVRSTVSSASPFVCSLREKRSWKGVFLATYRLSGVVDGTQ